MINNFTNYFILSFSLIILNSCSEISDKTSSDIPASYFENTINEVQTGGIKMIPITTPKGKFKVWTKRIGNHPTIKVLILHGGPGGSHDGYECFESFFPQEGIELIYYDQLACGNSDNPKILLYTTYRVMLKKLNK